jgi:hypothetical protein
VTRVSEPKETISSTAFTHGCVKNLTLTAMWLTETRGHRLTANWRAAIIPLPNATRNGRWSNRMICMTYMTLCNNVRTFLKTVYTLKKISWSDFFAPTGQPTTRQHGVAFHTPVQSKYQNQWGESHYWQDRQSTFKRNIEERSRKYCCSDKAISITYS